MRIEVILLPEFLRQRDLSRQTVIVFDVLRATTTITAALAVGIEQVRVFDSVPAALAAAAVVHPRPILCGEIKTVAPPGFDFGNSPRQFTPEQAGKTVFLATTNGTRAAFAARAAAHLFAGALVNAPFVAAAASRTKADILLLCSGTSGEFSLEDVLGCGAVCRELLALGDFALANDAARIAHRLFLNVADHLPDVLRDGQGGRNIIAAGLEPDIDFCARLGELPFVPIAVEDPAGIFFILSPHERAGSE
ncbi:MAG: 2-phosphosulfolactate phosphatase [Tepidisphaeraceae bacterium]|jgi:2-phosphosulfolactate phosphatase